MLYSELVDAVIESAFPEGIAENLESIHEKRVLDGLIEAQRWVPYLQQRHFALVSFGNTLYRQGATVLTRPPGRIKRLSVFSSKTLKDFVNYDPCTREEFDRLIQQHARLATYPDAVPVKFSYFNPTSANDKNFRAERGVFCIDKDQILILPHIESTERVCIEWEGSKTSYLDTDIVTFGKYERQVIVALENWLRLRSASKELRSAEDFSAMTLEWRQAVSGLQLDTQYDTEPEMPVEDIGILPRTCMPLPPLASSLGGCDFDPEDAFFSSLWMLAANGKFYDFGALLIDDIITERVDGAGGSGGAAEVTYDNIKFDKVSMLASDTKFYTLEVNVIDGIPNHAFNQTPITADCDTPVCNGTSVRSVDLLADDDNYYRITLGFDSGVPIILIEASPACSETTSTVD